MGSRRKAREAACRILYQMDLRQEWDEAHIAPYWELIGESPPDATRAYAEEIVRGVLAELASLDGTVEQTARHWSVERMPTIDRNILRAAAWELTGAPRLPAGVVIDEWLEISKKYGTEESPAFVNGILDRIAKRLQE